MPRKSDAVTLGEQLFQQACDATGIRYRRLRVAKAAGYQRPDYKVNIPGCGAIVEIKQIEPNAEDRRRIAEVAAGRMVVGSRSPGGRLRKAIQSGSAQLQRASLRGVPTAVAIFDTTYSLSYTDPYNVKAAMYGLDAIVIALPEGRAPYRIGMKSAGKEVLTTKHNTSISAVIIIRAVPPSVGRAPILLIYHNHFARLPFNPDILRRYVYEQFALGRADDGATTWVTI